MGVYLILDSRYGSVTTFGLSCLDKTSGNKNIKFSVILTVLSRSCVDSIKISSFLNKSSEDDFSCNDDYEV